MRRPKEKGYPQDEDFAQPVIGGYESDSSAEKELTGRKSSGPKYNTTEEENTNPNFGLLLASTATRTRVSGVRIEHTDSPISEERESEEGSIVDSFEQLSPRLKSFRHPRRHPDQEINCCNFTCSMTSMSTAASVSTCSINTVNAFASSNALYAQNSDRQLSPRAAASMSTMTGHISGQRSSASMSCYSIRKPVVPSSKKAGDQPNVRRALVHKSLHTKSEYHITHKPARPTTDTNHQSQYNIRATPRRRSLEADLIPQPPRRTTDNSTTKRVTLCTTERRHRGFSEDSSDDESVHALEDIEAEFEEEDFLAQPKQTTPSPVTTTNSSSMLHVRKFKNSPSVIPPPMLCSKDISNGSSRKLLS
eukprot:CAMPEP_0203746080 /NCGR_PEP_ID=MMETSP0098-20131031/1625_1 /ASSEMBLY_ACC=CAM_ASM_000208 /TAXON_ID=96639 /ORGANISM=" , Strain NY0313808BC1" /LENGTH=362 /DNA_ID=CAMNT_0050634051 /DNA_START=528 /DNA_END=1619 /DNA_ORIENTATION=-